MPPKRWGAAAPKGDSGSQGVVDFIVSQIKNNNCLSLPEEEIRGMATELAHSNTRAEVHEWATTLMLGEEFALEVIQRREKSGPAFEGEKVKSKASGDSKHVKVKKGKKRFVDVNEFVGKTKEGNSAEVKPGLFECGCFATLHQLKGNCANCGRIICEQEADDVCYSCGLDPSSCLSYEIAVQEGQITEAAQNKNQESYEAALARRDKLLEFAANRAKRTTVIDDQSATLFASKDAWITSQERKEIEKKSAKDERQRLIETLHKNSGSLQLHANFVKDNLPLGALESNAGEAGEATGNENGESEEPSSEEEEDVGPSRAEPLPTLLKKIWYSPDGEKVEEKTAGNTAEKDSTFHPPKKINAYNEVSKRVQQNYFEDDMITFTDGLSGKAAAELIFNPGQLNDSSESDAEEAVGPSSSTDVVTSRNLAFAARFAPTPVMRMKDEGVCLSMHQPWASLVVYGIKTHEGRVWGTDYRGRLWIHAAAVEPVNVEEVENTMLHLCLREPRFRGTTPHAFFSVTSISPTAWIWKRIKRLSRKRRDKRVAPTLLFVPRRRPFHFHFQCRGITSCSNYPTRC